MSYLEWFTNQQHMREFTDSDENELWGALVQSHLMIFLIVTARSIRHGVVIGKTILQHLNKCNLSFNAAFAQDYDSAQVMSSNNVRTSATIELS